MILIVSILAVIFLFYYFIVKRTSYWKDRGVVQQNSVWFFGDLWKLMLKKENVFDFWKGIYNLAPDSRYVGIYEFTSPALVIREPILIKQITVKDFDHFVNHRPLLPEGADPLWARNLLALKDQQWRDMRPVLSPSFTSSKMKMMYCLMTECAQNLVNHFLKNKEDVIEVSMKDVSARFANDIIASTAFGIHTDSLENKDNEFYLMGRDITDFSSIGIMLRFIAFILFPKLCKFLKMKLFAGASRKFFTDLIGKTLEERENKKIVRPDMINLLLEAKKGIHHKDEEELVDMSFATAKETNLEKPKIITQVTNEDIAAHALIFFFGGLDSVSNLMSFMSYELAINPDIQTRLRQEIDEGLKQCNGRLDYSALMKMKYLDMVVSETLRKWPNFPTMDRVCTKAYTIEPECPNEPLLVINKGTVVVIPIIGLQHDPKYYQDPERFNPERFSDENKETIDPYTYIPFGFGPRNCIGSRFALLETKALFAYLLHTFEIVPTANSTIPVVLSKNNFSVAAEDGMTLGLKRIRK